MQYSARMMYMVVLPVLWVFRKKMCFTGCCCRCADANDAAVVVAVDTAPDDDGVDVIAVNVNSSKIKFKCN